MTQHTNISSNRESRVEICFELLQFNSKAKFSCAEKEKKQGFKTKRGNKIKKKKVYNKKKKL